MKSTTIPAGTLVLLLLFKVVPPWADSWSDVAWIHKLSSFGEEWISFNVSTYEDFLHATDDCDDSQFWEGNKWVKWNVNRQIGKSADDISGVSKEELFEINNAQRTIDSNDGDTKARCKKEYTAWAFASALPIVINVLFTLVIWWTSEKGWAKLLLLPVVIIGLYSQYRAIKLILIGLGMWANRKPEDWVEEKENFTRVIVSIEPITDALLSLLIQIALLSTQIDVLIASNRPNPLGDNPTLFFVTASLSATLAMMGLTLGLKEGPSPLISSNQGYLFGLISKDFGFLCCSTFMWFSVKCILFSFIIYSRSFTSIVGIKLPNGSIPEAIICWGTTLVLPQLLHAFIVLAKTARSNIFSLILNFPSFIITPLFTPFTYTGSCSDGRFEFFVSFKHTVVNIVLTFLLTPLTMILYYNHIIWEWTYNFGLADRHFIEFHSKIKSAEKINDIIRVDKLQGQVEN